MQRKQVVYTIVACILLFMLWMIPKITHKQEKNIFSIVCFGDSILGHTRDETGVVGTLEKKMQQPIFNGAFGGTRMSRINTEKSLTEMKDSLSMAALAEAISYEDFGPQQCTVIHDYGTEYFEDTIDKLAKIDFDRVEILVIEHGTNDYSYGVPIVNEENPYDQYTFTGALRRTLSLLKEKLPDTRIVLVTPTYCWFPQGGYDCETWMPAGVKLLDYVEAEKQIAKELGVEVIDNYSLFGTDAETDCYYYTVDGLHANELGREMIADSIYNYLKENP